jgi:DNA-binding response OmpR family regulator
VARVVALVPDLLLGSNVAGALRAAGHDVALVGSEADARAALGQGVELLLVDLAADGVDGVALIGSIDPGPRTLGIYSHVDAETRERALGAGFDQVVPRSRFAREGAALVDRLLAGGPAASGEAAGGPATESGGPATESAGPATESGGQEDS